MAKKKSQSIAQAAGREAPREVASKKAPAKPPVKTPAAGRLPRVRVRMYRQGLGDCFLITFHLGTDERHMLIDCGTLGATTTGVKLSDVVANIKEVTGNHLHLLIATHERANRAGVDMAIAGAGPEIQRVFHIAGLDGVLPVRS